MKKSLIYIYIIFLFASCEKQTTWDLESEQKNIIVVDGMITNEKKEHTIKISFPVDNLNDTAKPVTGAAVVISDFNSVYTLSEQPANSGIYKTSSDFAGIPGTQYTLFISYNNIVYTAKTRLLPGIDFHPLLYEMNTDNGLFYITTVSSNYNAKHYAIWEILLDWSNVEGYQQCNPDSCKKRLLYYTLPTIDVSQTFAPSVEKIYFPTGTLITERRYSITEEHAQFIRAMLSETNWTGGFFDSSHSNVPTNISNGAIGFFSACGVETLYLSVIP
ncbi:MAG TPA: DUF4249 family protein [Bacteroidales bacterium]|nr:DUF4249 family protein [Bacteroidales bacterium]HPS16993.1 DUF4249 family protein [Bacteroidales bacterium]